ncbi:hypothetical protein CLF_104129, partial [Clonorchis sinensis]
HSNADTLSRRPTQELESANVLPASHRMNWEEQSRDRNVGEIYRPHLQGNSKPFGRLMASRSPAASSLWSRWGQLRITSKVWIVGMASLLPPHRIVASNRPSQHSTEILDTLDRKNRKLTLDGVTGGFCYAAMLRSFAGTAQCVRERRLSPKHP